MKNARLVLGSVVALAIASPKRAECDGCPCLGGDATAAVVLGGGFVYVGVTLGFLVSDITEDDLSPGYGGAEFVIHAPIAGLAASAADDQGSISTGFALMAVVHGALAVHGLYTIAKDRPAAAEDGDDEQPKKKRKKKKKKKRSSDGVTARLVAAPMHDGAGVGMMGSF